MRLIRVMQRQDVPLDPDGVVTGPDRGSPDFQESEKAVWQADLGLARRNLESLRQARNAHPGAPGLESLITEGAAFVADLQARIDGTGNVAPTNSGEAASDAEGRSLEDFLDVLEDTDERFLAGEADRGQPADDVLFAVLNTVLNNHFLAIEQFFLQGFQLEHLGEKALGEARIQHSVDEMTLAFRVTQHINLVGSRPRPVFHPRIRLSHRVNVGRDPLDAIGRDLDLTDKLVTTLEGARTLTDPGTADILSRSLETERSARRQLSGQFRRLREGGAPDEASGRFDMMLQRWAVA